MIGSRVGLPAARPFPLASSRDSVLLCAPSPNLESGCSSGVERQLPKLNVARSNRVTRSNSDPAAAASGEGLWGFSGGLVMFASEGVLVSEGTVVDCESP